MSSIRRHPLWVLIAAGVAIRLALAFGLFGNSDIRVFEFVGFVMHTDALDVYTANNPTGDGGQGFWWPYPPLYLVWIWFVFEFSINTGLPFHGIVQLLPILADVGIALAIHRYLGWRDAGERTRLAGAALVLLGPCFIAVSGYHGQLDQVAILPAVLALMAWERRPAKDRAIESGLLVGAGAALKMVPGLLVLPLLACASSWREGAKLLGMAVAVPAVLFIPFVVTDPSGVLELRQYQGIPGFGGLGLVTEPGHGGAWMTLDPFEYERGAIGAFVSKHGGAITFLGLLGLTAFLVRHRPAPLDAAVLLWLTIYVFSPNFFMQYLLWGLPFFIMAGYLREVAILQVALVPALLIFYLVPFSDPLPWAAIYVPMMICLWAFWVAALATLATRVARQRRLAVATAG